MKNDSTPKDEIIECSCGECYKKSYHGVVCPNCAKVNKPVIESTPSEGWEDRFKKRFTNYVQKNESKFLLPTEPSNQDTLKWLGKIEKNLNKDIIRFISQEIAKARQEVMMTELVHCEEAIERARQEERQEIAEWAKRYDKRNDGINKSDLIKKLEEE